MKTRNPLQAELFASAPQEDCRDSERLAQLRALVRARHSPMPAQEPAPVRLSELSRSVIYGKK